MTFLAREARDPFSGPGGPGCRNRDLVTFLWPVSGSVSRHVKNPQSGKIREVSGKVSGKSNTKSQRVGTRIKNGRHIYMSKLIYRVTRKLEQALLRHTLSKCSRFGVNFIEVPPHGLSRVPLHIEQ